LSQPDTQERSPGHGSSRLPEPCPPAQIRSGISERISSCWCESAGTVTKRGSAAPSPSALRPTAQSASQPLRPDSGRRSDGQKVTSAGGERSTRRTTTSESLMKSDHPILMMKLDERATGWGRPLALEDSNSKLFECAPAVALLTELVQRGASESKLMKIWAPGR
jgi:hypothetical protein